MTTILQNRPQSNVHDVEQYASRQVIAVQQQQQQREKDVKIFFDLTADGRPLGRVVFQLDYEHLPLTCENFRVLCTGESRKLSNGHRLHFKGCKLHAIYPEEGVVASGDVINNNGTGGHSIYGDFFDEPGKSIGFERPGTLAMLHFGPHRNNSQFFINVHASNKDKYETNLAFGYVTYGLDVLEKALSYGTDLSGEPTADVTIAECGQL